MYASETAQLIERLGLEKTATSVEFLYRRSLPGKKHTIGDVDLEALQVRVCTRLSRTEVLVTLAHELRHVWQRVSGAYTWRAVLNKKQDRFVCEHTWHGSLLVPKAATWRGELSGDDYLNCAIERDARLWSEQAAAELFGIKPRAERTPLERAARTLDRTTMFF